MVQQMIKWRTLQPQFPSVGTGGINRLLLPGQVSRSMRTAFMRLIMQILVLPALQMGISLNSSQLTSAIGAAITARTE